MLMTPYDIEGSNLLLPDAGECYALKNGNFINDFDD